MEIILIGLGASGVSFLKQFNRLLDENRIKNIKISIISNRDYFATGEAFGKSESYHLTNTPSNTMGLDIVDPMGYAIWLKKNNVYKEYTERETYSKYIKETYIKIKEKFRYTITEYRENAIDISKKGNKIEVTTENNKITGDILVYTPGHIGSSNFHNLIKHPNFISNPYQNINISNTKSVCILGSSLTAIDTLRTLKNNGYSNKITLYSKNGFLPTVITKKNIYIPKYFNFQELYSIYRTDNKLTLSSILNILKKELKDIDFEYKMANSFHKKEDIANYYNYLIKRADNADLPLQDILVSTRNYAYKIWNYMDEKNKIEFNKNYSAIWNTWRHPIPIHIAKEILYFYNNKEIEIKKISNIRYDNNLKKFIIIDSNNVKKVYDYVVDATGGNLGLKHSNNTLIKNLISKKYIVENKLGGIQINPITFKVKNDNIDNFYAFGQITKGTLFSTNAMWFNVKIANEIAIKIINDIKR